MYVHFLYPDGDWRKGLRGKQIVQKVDSDELLRQQFHEWYSK